MGSRPWPQGRARQRPRRARCPRFHQSLDHWGPLAPADHHVIRRTASQERLARWPLQPALRRPPPPPPFRMQTTRAASLLRGDVEPVSDAARNARFHDIANLPHAAAPGAPVNRARSTTSNASSISSSSSAALLHATTNSAPRSLPSSRSQPCELGCDQFSPSPNKIVQCSEQYLFRDDRDRDVDIRGAARPD